jgi:hypothetical protein
MRTQRLGIFWPLLIIIAAALWLFQALGILPTPISELLSRAWPAALIALGIALLLGRRVRFGNVIAVVLSVVVVGGTMAVAFSQQSGKVATDNQKSFAQPVEDSTTTLNITVTALNTDIIITPGTAPLSTIGAEFVGSRESRVTGDYKVDGSTGNFTLVETLDSAIPSLTGLGRGKITLALPVGKALQQINLTVNNASGSISFDGTGSAVTALTITANNGKVTLASLPQKLTNLTVTGQGDLDLGALPTTLDTVKITLSTGNVAFDATGAALKNLSVVANAGSVTAKLTEKSGLIGDIKSGADITVTIPATIAANIQLAGNAANSVTFNQADYILNIDKVLVSRRSSEPQMQLKLDAAGKAVIQ